MWTCRCPHRPVRAAPCSENTVDELVELGQLTLAAKGGILGHAPCVAISSADIAKEIMGPTATPIRDFALHQFYTADVMAAHQEMEAPSGS
jgi:hypothetical protein